MKLKCRQCRKVTVHTVELVPYREPLVIPQRGGPPIVCLVHGVTTCQVCGHRYGESSRTWLRR
jgi:hypothetical protein